MFAYLQKQNQPVREQPPAAATTPIPRQIPRQAYPSMSESKTSAAHPKTQSVDLSQKSKVTRRRKEDKAAEIDLDVYMALTKGDGYIEKQLMRYQAAKRLAAARRPLDQYTVKGIPKSLLSNVSQEIVKTGDDDDLAKDAMAVRGQIPNQSGVKVAPKAKVQDVTAPSDSGQQRLLAVEEDGNGAEDAADAPIENRVPVKKTDAPVGLPSFSKLFLQ